MFFYPNEHIFGKETWWMPMPKYEDAEKLMLESKKENLSTTEWFITDNKPSADLMRQCLDFVYTWQGRV